MLMVGGMILTVWAMGIAALAWLCQGDATYPRLAPVDRLCLWLTIAFWPLALGLDLLRPIAKPREYGVDEDTSDV